MQVFYSVDVQSTLCDVSCREDGFSCSGIASSRAWQTCIHTPVLPARLWPMGSHLSILSPCSLGVSLRFCGRAWGFLFVLLFACFNGEGIIWKAVPWPPQWQLLLLLCTALNTIMGARDTTFLFPLTFYFFSYGGLDRNPVSQTPLKTENYCNLGKLSQIKTFFSQQEQDISREKRI